MMTAHGFRAMARTILDEVLEERADLIEHQLAHAVKDVNGRAYNRRSHLPARRAMMQRWSDYLDKLRVGADVLPLKNTAQISSRRVQTSLALQAVRRSAQPCKPSDIARVSTYLILVAGCRHHQQPPWPLRRDSRAQLTTGAGYAGSMCACTCPTGTTGL